MISDPIVLRPITDLDEEFLYQVYASTRQEELARVTWPAGQKEAFLRQQFTAQHAYYMENYRSASFDVIEVDGQPVGRLYLARGTDEVRIVDIALLPPYRRRGIGGQLLERILAQAQAADVPVTIHVERNNPAMGLYQRLGFQLAEDKGVYLFLKKEPGV